MRRRAGELQQVHVVVGAREIATAAGEKQLGRGLRLAPTKEKVIVLDFVSDIRRFAAGIDLKDKLEGGDPRERPVRVRLPNSVSFRRVGGNDPESESFLRQWLNDVAAVQDATDDESVLRFPPTLPGGHV